MTEQRFPHLPRALPRSVRLAILTMRGGQRLCKRLHLKQSGETEVSFTFEPSGKRCRADTAAAAIKTPFVRPLGDGLFEPEFSQTFEAAQ